MSLEQVSEVSEVLEASSVAAESVARESYDRLVNQLATLRTIADKACLVALQHMDMEQVPTDDITTIGRYIERTEYLDQGEGGEAELDFVRDVIHPLMGTEVSPLMDYVGMSQREMARKRRIKDELGQLKVIRDSIHRISAIPPELMVEIEASRTALLFASSDVLEHASLMELSPSVRIARTMGRIKKKTDGNRSTGIDWSEVDAEHGQ
jgi:hypothetical protein